MVKDVHTEREITFDGVLSTELSVGVRPTGVARAEAGAAEVLDAVYFDTPDHGLLRHGVTLRRRVGGHDAGWHLKVPAEHGGRREFGQPLRDERPLRDEGTEEEVPSELRQLACAYARGRRLGPVAHLRTHRRRVLWLDADEQPLAELAADHVAARVIEPVGREPGGSGAAGLQTELSTWDETEVELKGGSADLLDDAARELAERGLRPADRGVKLARALHAAGLDPRPVAYADVAGAGSTAEAVVAALRQHAERLIALDPAVRLDEPDAVHQMRVTARRLRSLLRACDPLFDGSPADGLAADLRWLGHELGAYREPEALRERLTAQARELPADCGPRQAERKLRKVLDRRCRRAHRALLEALSSARYFTLLDRLEAFVADPPLRAGKHRGSKRAARILKHETRRTRRRLRTALRLPEGPGRDEALHGARKAAKRTRYVAGALRPVLGSSAAHREARYKEIHKRLGQHQDARGAEQTLTELAQLEGTRPGEAFAFGVLRTRQRAGSPADIAAARRAAGL